MSIAVLKPKLLTIDDNTRYAVQTALDNNYPFAMVAMRPDGTWESSLYFQSKATYEVVGALESLKHRILFGEDDE